MSINDYLKDKIVASGYAGKRLSFNVIAKLHEQFAKDMEIKDFAINVLEIDPHEYRKVYIGRIPATMVLKSRAKECQQNRVEEIKNKMALEGYSNKLIDMDERLFLYIKYGDGLSSNRFYNEVLGIKAQLAYDASTRILKDRASQNEQFVSEIQDILIENGYAGKKIDYAELVYLHQKYASNMNEYDFAKQILELDTNQYNYIKFRNGKSVVIKSKLYLKEKAEQDTINSMIKDKIEGKVINAETFEVLYVRYGKNMDKNEFAKKILGLPNYKYIKEGGVRAKIIFNKEIFREIKKSKLSESRYYTSEELQNVCDEYGVSINRLLLYLFGKIYNKNKTYFKNKLNKGKIWIGKVACSDDFALKNYKKIEDMAYLTLNKVKQMLKVDDIDEEKIIKHAIDYVINERGDIEKNFEDDETLAEATIMMFLKKVIISDINIEKKRNETEHQEYETFGSLMDKQEELDEPDGVEIRK